LRSGGSITPPPAKETLSEITGIAGSCTSQAVIPPALVTCSIAVAPAGRTATRQSRMTQLNSTRSPGIGFSLTLASRPCQCS